MKRFVFSWLVALSLLGACQKERKIPLAIVTPGTHPSLELIEKGFKETIEAHCPGKYRFITYNAQGDRHLLRGEIEEIAQNHTPLVFTLGTLCSTMTKEIFCKKGLSTPIVFTCVSDPVGFHLVESEESPEGCVTGVKELLDFKRELELLLDFKPSIHTLLLVMNPMDPQLVKDEKTIRALLGERGVELVTVNVFQTGEFMAKISPQMKGADAMLVLKDNLVASGLNLLIKLCGQYRIPLMASDLDSPERGAAFGYGVHEIEFGIEGAKKALQILEEHKAIHALPVTAVSDFAFKVNREAAKAQGICLDERDSP